MRCDSLRAPPKTRRTEPGRKGDPAEKIREPIRLKVSQLNIDGLTFHLNREGKESQNGTLPAIHMRDIGGEKGITPHGLGIKVSARLAGDIMAVVLINRATEKMNSRMEDALKDLEKKLRK